MDNLVVSRETATAAPTTTPTTPVQFGAATNFPAGRYPVSLLLADFNGDGKTDILTAGYDGAVLLLKMGNPFFVSSINSTVNSIVTLATGDFNGAAPAVLRKPT